MVDREKELENKKPKIELIDISPNGRFLVYIHGNELLIKIMNSTLISLSEKNMTTFLSNIRNTFLPIYFDEDMNLVVQRRIQKVVEKAEKSL
jgi:hypothetical protein